jgi:DNA-binding transcriptional LysR family regulator
MEFDLRQLEAFVSVVERGGFSAASSVVHLSQAAVSERIANLEHAIGMRLLDRSPRDVRATAVGSRFYSLAKQLLEHKEAIKLELFELQGVIRGALNVGASTIPGEYVLPSLLPRFLSLHPLVELNVLIHDTADVIAQVLKGDAELGIVGAAPKEKKLAVEKLWDDRLVLVVPTKHRLAGRKQVHPRELAQESIVMREQGSGMRKLLETVLEEHDIELPTVSVTLSSTTAIKEAVIAGLGIALLSERAIRREMQAGMLVGVQVRGLHFDRSLLLITQRRRTQSPLCRCFIDYLRQYR